MFQLNNPSRRRLFTLIGGSTTTAVILSSHWTTPIINTVSLPAHARTSSFPIANLTGVVDGLAGTTFIADATASVDPIGDGLSYDFSVSGACSILNQADGTATISRAILAGTCEVTVTVSNAKGSDMASVSASVTAGPPPPP